MTLGLFSANDSVDREGQPYVLLFLHVQPRRDTHWPLLDQVQQAPVTSIPRALNDMLPLRSRNSARRTACAAETANGLPLEAPGLGQRPS
jgi:hypothetical protein